MINEAKPRRNLFVELTKFIVGYGVAFAVCLIFVELVLGSLYFHKKEKGTATLLAFSRLQDKFVESSLFGIEFSDERYKDIVVIEETILEELSTKNAVISNAYNPTKTERHKTILVEPHPDLKYRLKKNVSIQGHLLHSKKKNNFDPPILYINKNEIISESLRQYIANNTRVSFSVTTNSNHERITKPEFSSSKKVLIVGDSVAFGVGTGDAYTSASFLQSMLGDRAQVINAGVGGYDGYKSLETAKMKAQSSNYEALIYIACQNDFRVGGNGAYSPELALDVFKKFEELKNTFNGRVIMILQTYMAYNMRDVLADVQGWDESQTTQTNILREEVKSGASKLGIEVYDFTHLVDEYRLEKKSVFAPAALYVDHSHFSPEGNELIAEFLHEKLIDLGL